MRGCVESYFGWLGGDNHPIFRLQVFQPGLDLSDGAEHHYLIRKVITEAFHSLTNITKVALGSAGLLFGAVKFVVSQIE